ncbi:orotidine-5'-phosphate decarboxylase [Breoghania corrubedonensis]|uniref:Orotidine 5'-phosphate decarboxylase n=1 Tax=Breoghania corrubedonensis TaxID=665038 RepID=A0A2T5VHH7_9HYPH|nr:orotidine-5'-phosphate decarboxylase [Breoghania corrubedonensis]PTW63211.1 orotidine-5'-phosphate decarboxylase [Breoghania corrubedonensis]
MSFKPETATDRLILPLDVPTVEEARTIVAQTKGAVGVYKIGMQLQFAGGLPFAQELAREGQKIFLDVKLLDIDNTVEQAVRNIAKMGMTFVTIHAYPKTMRAAVAGLDAADLCLLGVTVLTSMDDEDVKAAGYAGSAVELVKSRAVAARAAGMGGIVCSPREAGELRDLVGADLVLVTPGVRPVGASADDQRRVMTPGDAIRAGADYIVCGRPITGAADRRKAAEDVVEEIAAAL